MKNKFLFMLALLFATAGCSDDPVQLSQSSPAVDETSAMSRSTVGSGNYSRSNPYLLNNWESQKTITLNSSNSLQQGNKVTAPWANGCSSMLSEDFRKDIRKADGWKMVFHTFESVGTDSELNYMFFYNIFTGTVKVFYYYEGNTGGSVLNWHVTSSKAFAFLENPDFTFPVGKAVSTANHLVLNNATPGSVPSTGWNGFEFRVARYAQDFVSSDIKITPSESLLTNFKFHGIEESDITGTITFVSSTTPGYIQSVANTAGGAAKSAIDKFADKHFSPGSFFSAAISAISSANYASAITSGLKFLFGGSLISKTTYSVSDVKLKSTGSISTDGLGSTAVMSGMKSVNCDLYSILNPVSDGGYIKSGIVYGINRVIPIEEPNPAVVNLGYLGNWTLASRPTVYYDKVSKFDVVTDNRADEFDCTVEFDGYAHLPEVTRTSVDVVFNPNIKDYITSYSVKVELMDVVRKPIEASSNSVFDNMAEKVISDDKSPIMRSPAPTALFGINRNNLVYSDNVMSLYTLGGLKEHYWCLGDLDSYDDINQDTQYYFRWNDIKSADHIAFVTVTMKVSYLGNNLEFKETRPYNVVCKLDPNTKTWEQYHNPPYSFVVNIPSFQRY